MNVNVVLHKKELNEAITAYILKAGYPVEGMKIEVNLTKGRTNGDYATVEFIPEGDEPIELEDSESIIEVKQPEEAEPEEVDGPEPEEEPPFVAEPNAKKSLFN